MVDILLSYVDNFSHENNCYRCNFCQQLLTCTPISKQPTQPTGWWNCLSCKTEFFTEDSKLIAIVFVNIKLKHDETRTFLINWYEMIINLELRNTSIEWINNTPLKSGISYKHQSVLTLDMIVPGITPQNIEDKLNTLLIFS